MKLIKTLLLLSFSFLSLNAFAVKGYTGGRYEVDPFHTRISFVISHLMISEVEGRFNDVKGEFFLAEPFAASTFSATVPVSSIDTGVKKRDDDLKSKNFFEVAKFPNMKMVSKSITGTDDSFKVIAALTIKGVTKDVVFEGKCTGFVVDPSGLQRAAIQMTGTIDRRDFNITHEAKAIVGHDVKIKIWTEGIAATSKAKISDNSTRP